MNLHAINALPVLLGDVIEATYVHPDLHLPPGMPTSERVTQVTGIEGKPWQARSSQSSRTGSTTLLVPGHEHGWVADDLV